MIRDFKFRDIICNKKYIFILGLLFITVFAVIFTASYAFFTTTVTSKDFVVYTGNLAVNYKKKTNVINLDNLYPMTNNQGLESTPHEFTVENDGNIDARYQIRLELAEDNMIPVEYVKISYQENDNGYSNPVLLSDLNSNLVFLSDRVINPTKSNDYSIKLWIDLSAPNDIQGKAFKARIVIDSIQNVEDGYITDTVPIITLNKTDKGTTDINLELNDTYNELGVLKVEDDQDILTPNQVVKNYEYYDGENLTTVDNVNTSKTGIYYITYSITDKSNNVGKATRIVTVNNTKTIPSISLNGESAITLGEDDNYIEKGVTVEDNNKITILGEVKTSKVGTYIVRYIVVDKNNNLNSVIRTIIVNEAYKEELLNGADPVLTKNLVPVQISDTGVVTKASTASTWYDYETKNWANVVVLRDDNAIYENGTVIEENDIESYFVWIPKYSYQLWDLGNYSGFTSIESKERTINIRFGLANTSDTVTGECTTPGVAGENGNCSVADGIGDYMTHPAFLSFNTNGFWVGKFETGFDGATTKAEAQVNSSDNSKIIIKPNVYSWRSNTVGNMFKASLDYLDVYQSHMMKNTEWGAVAYLQHSIYGSQLSVRINNNGNYITGYAGTEEPILGYNNGTSIDGNRVESTELGVDGTYTVNYLNTASQVASTTGNYTGIYDMSGGAWEYVMGYTTGSSTVGGSSGITKLHSDFFTDSSYNKYYDKYSATISTDYNNKILGDATGEMGPFEMKEDPDGGTRYKSSWYMDHAYFATSDNTWFERGGRWNRGNTSGIFAFSRNTGESVDYISFRIVLAPTK